MKNSAFSTSHPKTLILFCVHLLRVLGESVEVHVSILTCVLDHLVGVVRIGVLLVVGSLNRNVLHDIIVMIAARIAVGPEGRDSAEGSDACSFRHRGCQCTVHLVRHSKVDT